MRHVRSESLCGLNVQEHERQIQTLCAPRQLTWRHECDLHSSPVSSKRTDLPFSLEGERKTFRRLSWFLLSDHLIFDMVFSYFVTSSAITAAYSEEGRLRNDALCFNFKIAHFTFLASRIA